MNSNDQENPQCRKTNQAGRQMRKLRQRVWNGDHLLLAEGELQTPAKTAVEKVRAKGHGVGIHCGSEADRGVDIAP